MHHIASKDCLQNDYYSYPLDFNKTHTSLSTKCTLIDPTVLSISLSLSHTFALIISFFSHSVLIFLVHVLYIRFTHYFVAWYSLQAIKNICTEINHNITLQIKCDDDSNAESSVFLCLHKEKQNISQRKKFEQQQ